MKKYACLVVIRKVTIKNNMKYHQTSTKIAKIKDWQYSVDKLVQKLELSHTVGGSVNWYKQNGKLFDIIYQSYSHAYFTNPRFYPFAHIKYISTHLSPKDMQKKVYSSTILNTSKLQTTHISMKWISKLWYIDWTEYYTEIRKNKLLLHAIIIYRTK